jgi:hypothetical protein
MIAYHIAALPSFMERVDYWESLIDYQITTEIRRTGGEVPSYPVKVLIPAKHPAPDRGVLDALQERYSRGGWDLRFIVEKKDSFASSLTLSKSAEMV